MSLYLSTEWVKASYSDIVVLESIYENPIVTHMTAFHSQQAIEKCFKAIIEYNTDATPYKHDIILLKSMTEKYITIDDEDILEDLNELYIDSRYPGDMGLLPHGKPTLEDAKEFYNFANDFFIRVCKLLDISIEEIKADANSSN